jgi:hypothetical protein
MEGVLKTMLMTKIKLAFAGTLVTGVMTYALAGGSLAQDNPGVASGGGRSPAAQPRYPASAPQPRPAYPGGGPQRPRPEDVVKERERIVSAQELSDLQAKRAELQMAVEALNRQIADLNKRIATLARVEPRAPQPPAADPMPVPAGAGPQPRVPPVPPAPPALPQFPRQPQPVPMAPGAGPASAMPRLGPGAGPAPSVDRLTRIDQSLEQLRRDNARLSQELRELKDLILGSPLRKGPAATPPPRPTPPEEDVSRTPLPELPPSPAP